MKRSIWAAITVAVLAGVAGAEGTVLFSDSFDAAEISAAWTVVEGDWSIADGALTNTGGGLIVLNQPPGNCFELEAEINFPPNWMSVVLFYETPDDYGTLYFGGGYWESFEIEGGQLADYVQRRDTSIQPGVDRQIRAICDRGRITLFYNGELKGEADLRPRPAARLAFLNIKGGGQVRVNSLRVSTLPDAETGVVRKLEPADLAESTLIADRGLQAEILSTEPVVGDTVNGLELAYGFAPEPVFESRFLRIPLEAAECKYVLLDVEGDGSRNKLFIIVEDCTGEQHLAGAFGITWEGWQECVANLTAFLDSLPGNQRLHTRWGGDESQVLDFPIRAVEIGVAKSGVRVKDTGTVRVRNLRLAR